MPKKNRSFGVSLATILMLVASLFGATSATADTNDDPMSMCNAPADSSTPGADGFTAPAPMKLDASGTDQDGICTPSSFFEHPKYGLGSYYVSGKAMEKGFHKAKGATSITVTSSHDSGTWTFTFTDDEYGEEVKNRYWVEVSDTCKRNVSRGWYRPTMAYAKNRKNDGRTFSVWPDFQHVRGWYNVVDTEFVENIPDGKTGAMRIMENEREGFLGLRPGVYRVELWQSDRGMPWEGEVVKRMKVTVPKCSKGGETAPTAKKLHGELKRVGCRAARVTADARGYSEAPKVAYKVVKKLKGKKTQKRKFAVKAGKKRVVVVKKPRRTATMMVLKVRDPKGGWVKLDRLRVPRCR